jgi:hypothetical protein
MQRKLKYVQILDLRQVYFVRFYHTRTNDEDSSPSDLVKMILSAEFVHYKREIFHKLDK